MYRFSLAHVPQCYLQEYLGANYKLKSMFRINSIDEGPKVLLNCCFSIAHLQQMRINAVPKSDALSARLIHCIAFIHLLYLMYYEYCNICSSFILYNLPRSCTEQKRRRCKEFVNNKVFTP